MVVVSFLAIALAGCGPGRRGDGTAVTDAGTVVVVDSGSGNGGGTEPGTLGSGVPDEGASDCGCDSPASDDGSNGTGDGTSDGGDAGSGGLAGDGGDGSGDLRGLSPERRWLTAHAPGSSDVVAPRCIHGIVEDETGTPIPGATVSTALGADAAAPATTTGRAGHFCLKGALAQTAIVAVTAPDGSQMQQRVDPTQPVDAHGCVPVRSVFAGSP